MLWFFERNAESLQLETTYDNDTAEYVVEVRQPDGRTHVERFKEREAFEQWLTAFEEKVGAECWTSKSGGPVLLPYGWPDRAPRI
jgi:hypothetical protein